MLPCLCLDCSSNYAYMFVFGLPYSSCVHACVRPTLLFMLPCTGHASMSMLALPYSPCFHALAMCSWLYLVYFLVTILTCLCLAYLTHHASMPLFFPTLLTMLPRTFCASMSLFDIPYSPCFHVNVLPTLLAMLQCLCVAYLSCFHVCFKRTLLPMLLCLFSLPHSPCFFVYVWPTLVYSPCFLFMVVLPYSKCFCDYV